MRCLSQKPWSIEVHGCRGTVVPVTREVKTMKVYVTDFGREEVAVAGGAGEPRKGIGSRTIRSPHRRWPAAPAGYGGLAP
jgi:hypothetical protein